MRLMPCHMFFQLYVAAGRLSCQMYQRSADFFLGVPFNIASYALLTHLFAQQCDLVPGEFIWSGGDCHLYLNHLAQADLQLARTPLPSPRLVIKRRPASQIRGPKWLWVPVVTVVNSAGLVPISYFVFGRRPQLQSDSSLPQPPAENH